MKYTDILHGSPLDENREMSTPKQLANSRRYKTYPPPALTPSDFQQVLEVVIKAVPDR
jgi:hypothetical protein